MQFPSVLGAVVATTALLVGGCAAAEPGGTHGSAPSPDDSPSRSAPPAANQELPAGWRWESYGGVQVGVPGSWGWGNGSQRLDQWCVEQDHPPIVGRPGAATLVGCAEGADPPRSTRLRFTGPIVAFDRPEHPEDRTAHVGDRTTVVRNGVEVIIQAPAGLRRRIAATVHEVEVDVNGCPVLHPVIDDPARRPEPAADVAGLRDVTAVSACRYALTGQSYGADPRLISSLRLTGPDAARAVRAIAAAPRGSGPNAPDSCLAEVSYGDDMIVLRVDGAGAQSQVYLRYSGCDHSGFDDGTSIRRLTRAAALPFLRGPNELYSFSGPASKVRILRP